MGRRAGYLDNDAGGEEGGGPRLSRLEGLREKPRELRRLSLGHCRSMGGAGGREYACESVKEQREIARTGWRSSAGRSWSGLGPRTGRVDGDVEAKLGLDRSDADDLCLREQRRCRLETDPQQAGGAAARQETMRRAVRCGSTGRLTPGNSGFVTTK